MVYSETRIVIGGLAHVPVLIFIANFIKGKFGIKTEEIKETSTLKLQLYTTILIEMQGWHFYSTKMEKKDILSLQQE